MKADVFLKNAKVFLKKVKFAETKKHSKYPNCLVYKDNENELVVGDCGSDSILDFVSFIIDNFANICKIIEDLRDEAKTERERINKIKRTLKAIALHRNCFDDCGLVGHTANCITIQNFINENEDA